jgi:hypothetical protein
LPRKRSIWHEEIKAIYKGNATGKEYLRYNNLFIDWHKENFGVKAVIEEENVRRYVQE